MVAVTHAPSAMAPLPSIPAPYAPLLTSRRSYASTGRLGRIPPAQMKDYANVTKECLITAGASEEVIDVVPLPELHLLIGVLNHLLKLLITCFPGVLEVFKAHGIFRLGYNGGGLDGNNCKKLLQKLEKMRSAVPAHLQPVLDTLDTFRLLVGGCFSRKLINNYESLMNQFTEA